MKKIFGFFKDILTPATHKIPNQKSQSSPSFNNKNLIEEDFNSTNETKIENTLTHQTVDKPIKITNHAKRSSVIKKSKKKIHIYVGLDFGTSSSKVMYSRGSGYPTFPLLFRHKISHYPDFCLPTVTAFDEQGYLLLGAEAEKYLKNKPWNYGIKRLKVLLAGKHDQRFQDDILEKEYRSYLADCKMNFIEPEIITSIYLAYVMKLAKKKIQKQYKNSIITFSFNVSVPIDHIETNKVRDAFEKTLALSEILEKRFPSFSQKKDILETAKELFDTANYNRTDGFDREDPASVYAVPESIAQGACYYVSLHRRSGLHAMIDFGAGTTDVSIFILKIYENGKPAETRWFSALNIPEGSTAIEREIVDNGSEISEQITNRMVTNIILKSDFTNGIDDLIRNKLISLHKKTFPAWGQAYEKRQRQSEWDPSKVCVFVCGGGSFFPGIHDIFQYRPKSKWGPYQIAELPEPDDFDSVDDSVPFERMAVAYGLTRALPEYGEIILPSDVSPGMPSPSLPSVELPAMDDRFPKGEFITKRKSRTSNKSFY